MISLLLYGQRTAAVNTLYNNFVCLGVLHLLVVSGYHINVLFLLLNKLLKRIIPGQGSWILTCGILLFYLYLLNFDLTTLKAVIILFVSLFNTNFCKKKFNHNQRWCASFLLTLMAYPYGFLTVGFIYGFSMTLLFANLWSKIRPLAYWQQLLILNGFIFLVASGWNIYFNFSVNFTSILFNIILTPLIAIIYIINFIIVFIKPLHLCYTWFYFILYNYSWGLLKINFAWNVGALNFAVICCYYLLLLLACYYIKHLKKVFISLFVILIGVMFSFNFLVKPAYSITMLNVGNGQTIIMEDKWQSKVIAFDLGVGYGASSTLVSDYLRWKGINWINMVFISHHHEDHNNNLSDVQKKIWIFKLLNNDSVTEKYHIGDFTLQVLHHFENAGDENNNSLVILGTINKHHFLLMGDASKTVENKILNFLWPPIDLLQVSHHGSKSASSEEFISKIKPKTCFISATTDNHHKFPALQTLNTLKQYHCQIYQTNISHNLVYNINERAKSYLTTF
ncbi:ComEC/Rec2 family competence protein [Spiroplasma eriocheiris]|uniref:ComEC/Rec2 family competence protein n=1 Tax=Spiroplasma eriocheiris TaxID=315358 RepID=UPI0009C2E3BA|nr:ComEC/Rec2 family competence protein [Spiroplasma eriocheiris]AHF57290.1 putative DNA internalization-related competence protein ComEC [Spiroplasma eriocheiris CCTCC M 207170]